jgi:riboflavin biosynthesis pyrimidine reductase
VDTASALNMLRLSGVRSLLVEGGARVITALLATRLVHRFVVGCAPLILGRGVDGVGDLGIGRVSEGISLSNRSLCVVDDDVMQAWDVG